MSWFCSSTDALHNSCITTNPRKVSEGSVSTFLHLVNDSKFIQQALLTLEQLSYHKSDTGLPSQNSYSPNTTTPFNGMSEKG